MAKVRNPLSSEEARGKFGPVIVFSAWRSIKVVRTKVTPTNPRSTRQLTVRGILAGLSASWAAISSAQALAWRNFASGRQKTNVFGTYFASGFNAYQELNFFVVDNGGAANAAPPTAAFKGNLTAYTAAAGGGSGEIDLAWTLPAGAVAGDIIDVWVTSAMPNELRQAQESDFRHNQYLAGDQVGVTLSGLTASAWYWCKARFVQADGRAGVFQLGQAQAHA